MSGHSEMVEKVARASFKCWRDRMTEQGKYKPEDGYDQAFEDMSESERELSYIHARAVIEAMRVPVGAMIDAGKPWAVGNAPPNCWLRMIDAALRVIN